MTIDYEQLLVAELNDVPIDYDEQKTILYALGIGLGRDIGDRRELDYVYERHGPRTVPSFATMLVPDDLLERSGFDIGQMLHRTQSIELYRPLPSAGAFLLNQKVLGIFDHGTEIGAEVEIESELRRRRDDVVVCTLGSRLILRGDGGFNGPSPALRQRHKLPGRDADMTCDIATREDQALLFRLSGDMNALHVDAEVAADAGFSAPILHGRCTFGIACRAVLMTVCEFDFTLIKSFEARFSAPVFPGDLITTEMWQDGNVVSFRCRVHARNTVVINNGRCLLAV